MNHTSLVRAASIAAVVAIAACKSGGSSTAVAASSPAPMAAPAASNGLPSGVTVAMVTMGDSIYHARGCRGCHGADATGGARGPKLTGPTFMHVNGTYGDFVRIITTGVPVDQIKDASHTVPMPPRGGGRPAPLTDDQINAVAAYVYSLSHK